MNVVVWYVIVYDKLDESVHVVQWCMVPCSLLLSIVLRTTARHSSKKGRKRRQKFASISDLRS